MDALLRLFGIRRRNQEWVTFIIILLLFVFVFLILRGCTNVVQRSNALTVQQSALASRTIVGQDVSFRGTFEPREVVAVYINGDLAGRTVSRRDGTWHLTTAVSQPGNYAVQAVAVDSDGDEVKSARHPFEVYIDREFESFGEISNMHNVIDEGRAGVSQDELRFGSGVPQIDRDLDGITIAPGSFFITGDGTPGSTVLLTNNGASLGTAHVRENGRWRTNVNLFNEGSYHFEASNANVVGLSTTTANVNVATPTDPPTIGIVRDGAIGTVNLRGRGEAGSTILVRHNGDDIGTAVVSEFGTWSLTDIALADGDSSNTFTASVLDENGDIAATSLPVILNVRRSEDGGDTTDNDAAADGDGDEAATDNGDDDGDAATDNGDGETADNEDGSGLVTPTLQAAVRGGIANLSGTGAPNTTLRIMRNGDEIDTVDVDADGNWSLDSIDLGIGISEFVAQAEPSGDAVAISTPVIVSGELVKPTVDAIVSDGIANLSGIGAPYTTIRIMRNNQEIGTADVDANGDWSFDDVELEAGDNVFIIQAEPAGDAIAISDPLVVNGSAGSGIISVDSVDYDPDGVTVNEDGVSVGTIDFSGTGAPVGARVVVLYDGEEVGETTVDEDGTWTFSAENLPVDSGDHTAQAILFGEDDSEIESTPVTLAGVAPTGALRVLFVDQAAAGEEGEEGGEGDEDAGAEGAVASTASNLPTVELILDASWSMTFPLDSDNEADRLTADNPNSRFGTARNTLIDIVDNSLVSGQPIALRAFGNLRGNLECQTDLMIPVQPLDKEEMTNLLRGTRPQFNANTAIAASLMGAAEDLADVEGPTTIVLLTDGEETCEGDPAAEIQALRDSGIDVKIDVVGFAILDDDLRAEFESWAELGGGTYYDAQDAEALAAALASTLQASYTVLDADGEEVARGSVGGAAIELPLGSYTVEVAGERYEVEVGADGIEVVVE